MQNNVGATCEVLMCTFSGSAAVRIFPSGQLSHRTGYSDDEEIASGAVKCQYKQDTNRKELRGKTKPVRGGAQYYISLHLHFAHEISLPAIWLSGIVLRGIPLVQLSRSNLGPAFCF